MVKLSNGIDFVTVIIGNHIYLTLECKNVTTEDELAFIKYMKSHIGIDAKDELSIHFIFLDEHSKKNMTHYVKSMKRFFLDNNITTECKFENEIVTNDSPVIE